MILLFNHLPVSEPIKIAKLLQKVEESYGSDFYNIQGQEWLGDQLTVESLFPSWILKKHENDSENVLIVTIIKNYLRWLFSLNYGYGAALDWENIRSPLTINIKLLQGVAESYFPGADFSSSSLSDSLNNIRRFSIRVHSEYFDIKGTNKAIKHCLICLLGYNSFSTKVYTSAPGFITIKANIETRHKNFIEEHLVPAGIKVLYESV